MLNHFNFEKFKGKILITNDLGRFCFLNEKEFSDLLTNKIDSKSELYTKLKKDYFRLFVKNSG